MKLTIKAKTITQDSEGIHYTFDSSEIEAILRDNFDADVAIVNEDGEELRTFNTKEYLAASAFLHLQK